jgi:hypothetical protein
MTLYESAPQIAGKSLPINAQWLAGMQTLWQRHSIPISQIFH